MNEKERTKLIKKALVRFTGFMVAGVLMWLAFKVSTPFLEGLFIVLSIGAILVSNYDKEEFEENQKRFDRYNETGRWE